MDEREDFYEREVVCELRFNESGDCWHLCTPGYSTEVLFTCASDFSYGMLLMGIAADRFPMIHIFTFELMSNHIHVVMSGPVECCEEFFNFFKKRLKRFFISIGRDVDLSGFEAQLIPIQNLGAMRNEIVYVNRNGYLANSCYTYFSYPWGAGAYFFNSIYKLIQGVKFNSLSVKFRREILHSRDIETSDRLIFIPCGFLLSASFCEIHMAESFFRDAHHYCDLLTRNFEAYSQIADMIGDNSVISDSEVYSAIVSLSQRKFKVRKISSLTVDEKIDIARTMHNVYHTSGKQLRRILKLDPAIIDTLYQHLEQ